MKMKNVLKSSSEKITPLLQSVKDTGITVLKKSSQILVQMAVASTLVMAKGFDKEYWMERFQRNPMDSLYNQKELGLLDKKIQKTILENLLLRKPWYIIKNYHLFYKIDHKWYTRLLKETMKNNPKDRRKFIDSPQALLLADEKWGMSVMEEECEKDTTRIFNIGYLFPYKYKEWVKKRIEKGIRDKPTEAMGMHTVSYIIDVDRAWGMRLFEKLAIQHPERAFDSLYDFVEIHKKWGMQLIERVATKFPQYVIPNLYLLIEIDSQWAKKLVDRALLQSLPLKDLFSVIEQSKDLISIDRDWAIPLIKQVGKKVCVDENREDYLSQSFSIDISVLISIDKQWAISLLEVILIDSVDNVFTSLFTLIDIDRDWGMNLIAETAAKDSWYVMRDKEDLLKIDKKWGMSLIARALQDKRYISGEDFEFVISVDKIWGMRLIELLAPKGRKEVLTKISFLGTVSPQWALDLFLLSASEFPYKALAHAKEVIKINEKRGKEIIMTLALEYPFMSVSFLKAFNQIDVNWAQEIREAITRVGDLVDTLMHINDLHDSPDHIRYKSIEKSSVVDLYDMIVYGREEIYTSSYKELLKRFLKKLKDSNTDFLSFIEAHDYRHLGVFFEAATSYGDIDKVILNISGMNRVKKIFTEFLNKSISSKNTHNIVALTEVLLHTKNGELTQFLEKRSIDLYKNMSKNTIKDAFGILLQYFFRYGKPSSVHNAFFHSLDKNKYTIPDLTSVPSEDLFDQKGRNIQQYFFYNDADGHSTFQGFLARYQKDDQWTIDEGNKSFVLIQSTNKTNGKQMLIYANRPGFDGYDNEEQDGVEDIQELMKTENMTPSVIVHRGHSYHVQKTIQHIPKNTKITSLGSCGGYQSFQSVLSKALGSHILATKGIGTKFINEPAFKVLNETILSGKDVIWSEVWKEIADTPSVLNKYKHLKDDPRFSLYISPDQNFGASFVLRLNELYCERWGFVCR
ncbi:hypothetical protein COB57_00375 [Candidatus Peregrinibacteria bacterium]|nr:MAG: hypothetical protein COB57_00375 [Candidatus Peregrinibacteria bacterium]